MVHGRCQQGSQCEKERPTTHVFDQKLHAERLEDRAEQRVPPHGTENALNQEGLIRTAPKDVPDAGVTLRSRKKGQLRKATGT